MCINKKKFLKYSNKMQINIKIHNKIVKLKINSNYKIKINNKMLKIILWI